MNSLFHFSHKSVVKLYQFFAVLTLYSVLGCVMAYGFMMAFYAVNHTWVAPFIVTPTNDKILDMTARVVTSKQALSSLVVDRDRLEGSLGDFKATKAALDNLDRQFTNALSLQSNSNIVDHPELEALGQKKKSDNDKTQSMLTEIAEVEQRIDKDLLAGLITKGDAAMARTQLRQSRNAATDGLISEVLLRDEVRQKTPDYTSTVDALSKKAELEGSIVQLAIQIKSGEQQLSSDKLQIAELTNALDTAKDSPYFLATAGKVKFAFVPYDNRDSAREGVRVYDCYLNMVLCRTVGTIKRIFRDEERATHPVLKTDIRGFLVQLDLTDADAAKDKVLFVGRKPLLF